MVTRSVGEESPLHSKSLPGRGFECIGLLSTAMHGYFDSPVTRRPVIRATGSHYFAKCTSRASG
jgi:hypothetical protein